MKINVPYFSISTLRINQTYVLYNISFQSTVPFSVFVYPPQCRQRSLCLSCCQLTKLNKNGTIDWKDILCRMYVWLILIVNLAKPVLDIMLFTLCFFLLTREVIFTKISTETHTFLLKSHEECCSWTRIEHCALILLHSAILLGWLSTLSPCTCQTYTIQHYKKTRETVNEKHEIYEITIASRMSSDSYLF